jgi:hypothetical protein
MKTTQQNFTAMKGHVTHGQVVITPSGKEVTIVNTMRGWVVNGPDGLAISGNLPSAFDVEYFIVNGLYSS